MFELPAVQEILNTVTEPANLWETRSGLRLRLPLFMPVYQPREPVFQLALWHGEPKIEGIIVNSYFLYKQRELRRTLSESRSLKDFVGFHGLVTTDSGAFQGLTRKLYLNNKDIIRFQDNIGSDVIAPLDLITPPGDNRSVATEKLHATEKRIREGLRLVERGVLAGVQQGGRFLDLRHEAVARLVGMGVEYLAIGSLVPFFNVNHDLTFPIAVVTDARRMAGPDIPIHIYGAGDPCEIPFLFACGATIFDSASYARYAECGQYMTPYGALKDLGPLHAGEFLCSCPSCASVGAVAVQRDKGLLTRHNLWTICAVVDKLRGLSRDEDLDRYLQTVLEVHEAWFPTGRLVPSWRTYLESKR